MSAIYAIRFVFRVICARLLGLDSCSLFAFFPAEDFVGLLARLRRPLPLLLQSFQFVQLLNADNGFALGKFVTTQKRSPFALPDYKFAVFALVTFYTCRLRGRFWRQNVAIFVEVQDTFAIRIVAASEEFAESATPIDHWFSADRASMFTYFVFDHFAFSVAGAGKFASRVSRAAQEPSIFAEPVNHRLTTSWTFIYAGGGLGFGVLHLGHCGGEVLLERPVKFI